MAFERNRAVTFGNGANTSTTPVNTSTTGNANATPTSTPATNQATNTAASATGTTTTSRNGSALAFGTPNPTAEVVDESAATEAESVPVEPSQQSIDYINNYNADREQKIQNMYAGNLASQNAGLQTAYDSNLDALKTAYDENLNNLRTAYDNNTGSLKTAYDANTGTLKTAYDTNAANLANAYQQNLSDAYASRDQISPRYQESMNALSAEYERQRRNNNMQAAVNGINTGANSQMALGQSMAYQRNQGNLARSENEALNEAERGITDLNRTYQNQQNILDTEYTNNRANLDTKYANDIDKLNREYQNNLNTYATTYQNNLASMKTNYQNQIAQAAANNDYQLAAALLDEYGAQYDRMQNQAALLAEFGDFSAYTDMYGQEASDTMRKNWALRNPEIAWASGNLSAEDYFALTGRYPSDPVTGTSSATTNRSGSNGKWWRPVIFERSTPTGYYGS